MFHRTSRIKKENKMKHYQHQKTKEVRAVEPFEFAQPSTIKGIDGKETILPAVKSASEIAYDQLIADGFSKTPMTAKEFEAFRNPPKTPEQLAALVNAKRQSLLAETDALAIRHMRQSAALTAAQLDARAKAGKAITPAQFKGLEAYAQALRDLPESLKSWPVVADKDWPAKPVFLKGV
jgi:hypothetical protein